MRLLDHQPASFDDYRATGGGRALERALGLDPSEVIDEVSRSGLRGRGGAGFPTGKKWASTREDGAHFFVCNAAEGEPATFKDRLLLRRNPFLVLEGLAIGAHAVGTDRAFIGLKETFTTEIDRLGDAIAQMEDAGHLGPISLELALGPDHFLLGEETGLLEAIEGREPMPTGVPGFVRGIGGGSPPSLPTTVNNVETLAHVPGILVEGADAFREVGTSDSPGTTIVTIAGDVRRPGCYEVPMGTPLAKVMDQAGGLHDGRELMVVVPGASHRVITPERLDAPLSFEGMSEAGSALGAAGFAVFDDSACIVDVARLYARFLHVESCGQCPPCKEGSRDIEAEIERLLSGRGGESVDVILARCGTVMDGRKCELPTGTRHVMESLVRLFPDDFAAHAVRECTNERELVLPKIVDLDPERGFVYDEDYRLKQPDWTYASG